MIKYVSGNIFDSNVQTIVNPVNCVGIMGKGLALQFKIRYPKMFKDYKILCQEGGLSLGEVIPYYGEDEKNIIFFPTKYHWKDKSNINDIENGLKRFVAIHKVHSFKSVAFPMIGCGLGGLIWEDVKTLMEKYLNNLSIDIYVYI